MIFNFLIGAIHELHILIYWHVAMYPFYNWYWFINNVIVGARFILFS